MSVFPVAQIGTCRGVLDKDGVGENDRKLRDDLISRGTASEIVAAVQLGVFAALPAQRLLDRDRGGTIVDAVELIEGHQVRLEGVTAATLDAFWMLGTLGSESVDEEVLHARLARFKDTLEIDDAAPEVLAAVALHYGHWQVAPRALNACLAADKKTGGPLAEELSTQWFGVLTLPSLYPNFARRLLQGWRTQGWADELCISIVNKFCWGRPVVEELLRRNELERASHFLKPFRRLNGEDDAVPGFYQEDTDFYHAARVTQLLRTSSENEAFTYLKFARKGAFFTDELAELGLPDEVKRKWSDILAPENGPSTYILFDQYEMHCASTKTAMRSLLGESARGWNEMGLEELSDPDLVTELEKSYVLPIIRGRPGSMVRLYPYMNICTSVEGLTYDVDALLQALPKLVEPVLESGMSWMSNYRQPIGWPNQLPDSDHIV